MQTAQSQNLSRLTAPPAQADSLAAFRSQVSASFVPLRISTERPEPFAARMSSADADSVVFTEVVARPHLVERTPETIASGGSGYYKVSLLLSGSSILVQDGKELIMRPGDLSIYDTSRPYSLLFGEEFRNLIMMFPKDRLELPIPFTEQLTAVSLGQQHNGLAQILTAFLSQFPAQLTALDTRVRTKLAHTSLDLLGTMLSSILDADPVQRDPHQVLLQKIYSYVDQNLSSPTLSPGSIAAAHYISTRHLHALFRQADTTVSTWIRERRLDRCRTDLLDPVLADRAISSIAARWGFTDAAHFSRVFKAAYGVSPSEIRRT
ncbi:helix-turn-helix domain-containing protein [Leucobacter coleopterorum]|uniref:Helix-turn-helix domain-containing protein n=1 Tax=Leucobacter coleopterorum TaxID=2714933 RepID=A0ABX6JXE3_9MICO|nr:helix-turn-helix domain-containing protein [Leucobacter coleopterorum]